MKNLSTRTKMLLAIAGVVIVVVIAGLVLLGPADDLFGGAVFHISPQNPTIAVGQTIGMSINAWQNCWWSTSNANVAVFNVGSGPMNDGATSPGVTGTKSVYVYGMSVGQARITADCPTLTRSTTVTVK